MTCTHDIVERDIAVSADGYCPLCQATQIELLSAEVERYKKALAELSDSHVPDQPAAVGMSERDWAYRHVGTMRMKARIALESRVPHMSRKSKQMSFTPDEID